MKHLLFALCTLALCASSSLGDIKFLHGPLSEAVNRAQAEKKPVMIDFITDWCMWCDTLDRNTYTNARVAAFVSENVVPIKIDAEKGEGISIAKKYTVSGYPTILLINTDGEEIDRIVGYQPPEPFLKSLTDYVHGVNTLSQLKVDVQKNPSDARARYMLAAKYGARNDVEQAAEHYAKLLDLDKSNTLGHNDEAEYVLALRAMRQKQSMDPVEAFADKYPDSPLAKNAMMMLLVNATRTGDAEGAKHSFERYAAKYPSDAATMNNYAWECAQRKMNLEQAEAASGKAVSLASSGNERATYLDTEAAVKFAMGKRADAVRLESEALQLVKDAPAKDRKPYEEALARFKGASK
ncbi:MAG TPA: thioredoxin family protein [Bacteroidota bacterium]|nr:thioredoxin family protein [Bacteroidota bacterium]